MEICPGATELWERVYGHLCLLNPTGWDCRRPISFSLLNAYSHFHNYN